MSKLPVLDGETELHKDPVLLSTPNDRRWSFSFRFWEQTKHFGLDRSPPKWFVSLLEKLKELSCFQIDKFLTDGKKKYAWRYHAIDWNQQNIPIQRKDLEWVDAAYKDNPDDYPLLQFQVSQALGRVVGFWDENTIFNIVLLDPFHNIQPTKSHNYRVNACDPLSCEYTSLLSEISTLKRLNLCKNNCGYTDRLKQIPTNEVNANVLIHFLNDNQKEELDSVIHDKSTYTDVLMLGVEALK